MEMSVQVISLPRYQTVDEIAIPPNLQTELAYLFVLHPDNYIWRRSITSSDLYHQVFAPEDAIRRQIRHQIQIQGLSSAFLFEDHRELKKLETYKLLRKMSPHSTLRDEFLLRLAVLFAYDQGSETVSLALYDTSKEDMISIVRTSNYRTIWKLFEVRHQSSDIWLSDPNSLKPCDVALPECYNNMTDLRCVISFCEDLVLKGCWRIEKAIHMLAWIGDLMFLGFAAHVS